MKRPWSLRRSAPWLLAMVMSVSVVRAQPGGRSARPVVVASKPFGESYLLAEMFAQLLESRGMAVVRRPGLGATAVAFGALRAGAVDVYPEYTGTGLTAILGEAPQSDPAVVFDRVSRGCRDRWGIRWLPPLGFQNTYALAVRRDIPATAGLHTLEDLGRASGGLRAGFTPDFVGRADGLPGLERVYGARFREVRSLGAAVKYRALAAGEVDVIDGYSTDGLIARYDLAVLTDNRGLFPPYQAAAVVRAGLDRDAPRAISALTELSGRMDEAHMRRWNERVEARGEPVASVASAALEELGLRGHRAVVAQRDDRGGSFAAYLWHRRGMLGVLVLRHLALVAVSLGAAIVVGIGLGLALERSRRAAEGVIAVAAAIETVPGIALLAFMIPVLGIGPRPVVVALFLYALYPIVRSTYTGVRDADAGAVEAARALGMSPSQVLRHVRLPLAAPVVMAGVRTAAVLDVGTATLAAFIGGGGLGEPIVQGLALADTRMVLSGALPAVALALGVDGLLALCERALRPGRRSGNAAR